MLHKLCNACVYMLVREQLERFGSLLPPYLSWEMNSSGQAD